VNQVIELEEMVKTNNDRKKELKSEIKALELQIKQKGNELERLEDGADHQIILSSLTEKLRVWKDKESKLKKTIQKEEEAITKQ